ncbi:MAG: hypothetical protein B6D59_05580, partial [Campylobacteraceae bacterium 4484_4]
KSRVMILLTDGKSRGDNIPFDVAMKLVKQNGIKVYTVGIGSEAGEFNEKHLREIAKSSGGAFFHATDEETLKKIYEKIDRLEKSTLENPTFIKKRYYYEYPLFFAFLSLLFYTYLLNRRGMA